MVAGYQAGVESTQTQISYGIEATWAINPSGQFQAIRCLSETLADVKTRSRPSEINVAGEVSAAVTTQEGASGSINFALSWNGFDDFLSAAIGVQAQTWPSINVFNATGDITFTAGTNIMTSATAGKFTQIVVGMYVRTLGFSNAGNNGYWLVTAKASNQSITLSGPNTVVTETPAGNATCAVRGGMIVNGVYANSFYLQQKLTAALWLNYPGAYVTGFTISGGVGKFLQGSFSFIASTEKSNTADSSTGISAAPTNKVMDPCAGFAGFWLNGAPVSGATLDSFTITGKWNGAGLQYAMGSNVAQGVTMGMLEMSGQVKLFFKDFTLYAKFKAETAQTISFLVRDNLNQGYVFTFLNAVLINPQIDAGGPGQPVYAVFTIEGNPQAAGGTFQIDRTY